LDQLKLKQDYAENALKMMPAVTACNLSNIFEYMTISHFRNTTELIAQHSPVGCKMVYWNLMVPRKLSEICPDKFQYDEQISGQLTTKDRGFFYSGLHIDRRI
jgi:S-adenosylmethionine-diacylglycerol 3-amino-3-carboxypropyl transferase